MKYATVFLYGGSWTICEWSKTRKTAERKALQCEKRGGAIHLIWEVKMLYVRGRRRK